MPEQATCIKSIQETLGGIVEELQGLDEQLFGLVSSITPEPGAVLPVDLRVGAECVRSDLLEDAIETLQELAVLTEEQARDRRAEVVAAAEMLSTAA